MALIYTTLASDTFHRANANPIADPPWAAAPTDGIPANQILNNELCPTTGESISIYDAIAWPADQWAQFQIDACAFHTEVGQDFASGLLVMRRLNAANGYALEIDGPLGPACNVDFFVETTGGATAFFTGTHAVNVGSVIRMECFGTTISAYIDGVLLMSVTDSQLSAGGNVAIDTFETVSDPAPTNIQISNFLGGSITQGSAAWSPVDSRTTKPNSATFRIVNGAQIDDVQTSSNHAVPGTDSRKAGAPVASGTSPQNSRTAPPFHG